MRIRLTLKAALTCLVLTSSLLSADSLAVDGWRAAGSMTAPRADHTATLLRDGTVLVAGGRTNASTPVRSAELYDPATGRWSAVAAMAFARDEHTATLLGGPACTTAPAPSWCGKVLVAGGAPVGAAELYDPATRSWSLTTGPLATPRTMHTATMLDGPACAATSPQSCGRVLVVGGLSTTGATSRLPSAELYDPTTGVWSAAGSMTSPRAEHSAVLIGGGSVLVAGGQGADGFALDSAELYDPATASWSPAGKLSVPRRQGTLTLLPDGRPLFAGGLDSFSAQRRVSDIFDPPAPGGPWIAGPSMNVGRGLHTATMLPNGTTLVTGNDPSSPNAASAELLDAAGTAWSMTPPLLTGRGRHTATLLSGPRCASNCGRALVVGGRRGIIHLASAELFGPLPVSYPLPSSGHVTDLSARALSARRIRLTFSAPGWPPTGGTPARRYVIKQARRAFTAAGFERARSLCGGVCSFAPGRIGDRITLTVTGLVPNRRYHYGLVPLDGAGTRGPLSNYASARTRRDRIRPGRVRALSVRARGARARLRFRAPASDGRRGPAVRRFEIRQSTRRIGSRRAFRRARSLCRRTCRFKPRRVGSRLGLTVTDLCGPRRYFYAIRARDEGGNAGPIARFRPVRIRTCGGR